MPRAVGVSRPAPVALPYLPRHAVIGCEWCGAAVLADRPGRRWCSTACRNGALAVARRKPRATTECEHCGAELSGRADKRFCSKRCTDAHRERGPRQDWLAAFRRAYKRHEEERGRGDHPWVRDERARRQQPPGSLRVGGRMID